MSKYTKGPWKCGEDAGIWAGKLKICTLSYFQDKNNPLHVCVFKTEANARLIASAPELLEALKELYEAVDSCVELTPEILNIAKQAIAKAEGIS